MSNDTKTRPDQTSATETYNTIVCRLWLDTDTAESLALPGMYATMYNTHLRGESLGYLVLGIQTDLPSEMIKSILDEATSAKNALVIAFCIGRNCQHWYMRLGDKSRVFGPTEIDLQSFYWKKERAQVRRLIKKLQLDDIPAQSRTS